MSSDSIEFERFNRLPERIEFGQVAVCPRCRGRTKKVFYKNLNETRHKDKIKLNTPCLGCNGFGLIPNKGPIPITMPEDQR